MRRGLSKRPLLRQTRYCSLLSFYLLGVVVSLEDDAVFSGDRIHGLHPALAVDGVVKNGGESGGEAGRRIGNLLQPLELVSGEFLHCDLPSLRVFGFAGLWAKLFL